MIEKVRNQVCKLLCKEDSGHGMDHVNRVLNLSLKFAKEENADIDVVSLIALLHEVDDYKLFGKRAARDLTNARLFMKNAGIDVNVQKQVIEEIKRIGYSKRLEGISPKTIEGKIVSDADMCDVVGVFGLFRIFTYSLKHNRPFFDKDIFPVDDLDSNKYINQCGDSGVCHIFEKALRLKKLMLTDSGKQEIKKRHQITVDILYQLFDEVDASSWKEYLDNYLKRI